jgi:hypothetical protein
MADYLEDYRRRGGKAADSIESVARQNILGPLGEFEVGKLTTKRLADWHRAIAERPRRWRARAGAPSQTSPPSTARIPMPCGGGARPPIAC